MIKTFVDTSTLETGTQFRYRNVDKKPTYAAQNPEDYSEVKASDLPTAGDDLTAKGSRFVSFRCCIISQQ